MGEGKEGDTVEPWANIKDTTQLWTYLHSQKGKLSKLIPKEKRQTDGIYNIQNSG